MSFGRVALERGFEVVILTRPGLRKAELEANGFRVEYIDFARNAIDPLRNWLTIRRVARVLVDEQPAVLHNLALKFAFIGTIAGRMAGVPRIVNSVTGLGHLLVSRDSRLAIVRRVLFGLLPIAFATRAARFVFENADDAAFAVRRHWTSGSRLIVVPGAGVDTSRYVVGPEPETEPVRIAMVCRMLWQKGADIAVEAKRLLHERNVECELLLVGDPDPDNPHSCSVGQLEAWAQEPGVRWLGFVADVRTVWSECHIALAPSRGGEGLPRSLIEAAACGRPLVATDVPGIRDITRSGVNGILIPPNDPAALADALELLIGDRRMRKQYGEASRRIAEAEYQERFVAEKVAALYDVAPADR